MLFSNICNFGMFEVYSPHFIDTSVFVFILAIRKNLGV